VFDDDGILMTVDASQSELRCLAYLAKSKYLIDSYNKGIDMHTLVSNMTNIARKDAKTLNFAYVYGASEFRLQQELIRVGQSQYQAKQSTRKYLQSMEKIGIADYQKKLLTFADKYGYNYSIYGRIGERLNPTQVVNFPVQSFSADLNKIRIIQMYSKLREHNLLSRIWLEFHDAMELDVYKPELDTILKLIKEIDTTIPDLENNNIKLDLPLDIKYDRKNWS
jgi:DNA polymerase-1